MASPTAKRSSATAPVSVHPLVENELNSADQVMRLAFGTFLGFPEPETTFAGTDYVRPRWAADPAAAFAASADGELVGSNFATNWGSVAFFGPLTVRPDWWDQGIGRQLMAPVMDCFDRWGSRHLGLFTFAQSPKHIELYRSYGFWPRFLTAIMRRPAGPVGGDRDWTALSAVPVEERDARLADCRALTERVYEGLDLTHEITSLDAQGLGDTVLLPGEGGLDGLAVCHTGVGSEAGPETCFIKVGAARPGTGAAERFDRLLDACEQLAVDRGLPQVDAGVNLGRPEAYGRMIDRGFRTWLQGVTMHRPNESGYSHPGSYVLDDWR
ncbi:GNAT family N-acetyltransferase [Kitasatospora sp. NPDC054939]